MTYKEALARSFPALKIAGLFGVPVVQVMRDKQDRRALKVQERLARKHKKQAEFLASDEPFALTMEDLNARLTDEAAMKKWCALPHRYGNDPRSYRDGAVRVVLRLSATGGRTLGGVADYSSQPEAV